MSAPLWLLASALGAGAAWLLVREVKRVLAFALFLSGVSLRDLSLGHLARNLFARRAWR